MSADHTRRQDESTRAERRGLGAEPADSSAPTGRTAVAVSVLLAASSVLGLLRDLSIAGLFGASGETDAFLVAWTIPETVTCC